MSKSIKANYIYTVANTFLGLVFPIITFPYISRILQPGGIGLYNFYSSILAYVGLLANIGISLYATKKIAQYREDQKLRSKLTAEIFFLNVITTFCAYSLVFFLDWFIPQIHENRLLFYVMSLGIIMGPMAVNWFFQAMEDFKYITIRSLYIKFLSLILLFVFVRSKEDIIYYAIVSLIATVGSNFFNIIHLQKYIKINDIDWKSLNVFQHLKPSLVLFILNVVVSIYVNLDSIMLGFIQSEEAVGYYSVAVKISHIILSMLTSLGIVLLPRFSYLLEVKEYGEFNRLCKKSMDFTICVSLPIVVGVILLAQPLIIWIFGQEYQPSVSVLQIIAPIILLAGITNVLGIQILYPKGKENLVILSTLGAAIVNFLLNIFLIPKYSYNGAATATCIAEFIVLAIQVWLGKRFLPKGLLTFSSLTYLTATILMGFSVYTMRELTQFSHWGMIVIPSITGILTYGIVLLLCRNELAISIIKQIKNKIIWI